MTRPGRSRSIARAAIALTVAAAAYEAAARSGAFPPALLPTLPAIFMALFDALVIDDGAYKIVDLGHEAFERFFLVAQDIRFADEVRQRSVAPVILYVISPDAASVDAYAALARLFPQAVLIPVHNEMLGSAQHRDRFPPRGKGSALLHVPLLAPGLRRIIEQRPFSFVETSGSAAPDVPLDVHIELQRWMRKLFLEFRELELRVLMADLKSSIQS